MNPTDYVHSISIEVGTGEREEELVSNCCGARTTEPDLNNTARCLECKEGCVAEPMEEFEEIPQFKGTREAINNLTIRK